MAAIMILDETLGSKYRSRSDSTSPARRRASSPAKDVILQILQKNGVDGALYMSMEFGGPGMAGLNVDERMAICNMAVEAGAKTADHRTRRDDREMGKAILQTQISAVTADGDAHYSQRRDIDLSQMRPMVAKPPSPGNVVPVEEVAGVRVDQVYMGNCANGTITDLRQIASILKGRKIASGTRAIIVPATQKIYLQAIVEGLVEQFIDAGAAVSTPTCGACFGGHNGALADGEVGVATINRNFRGRAGHAGAKMYLCNSYVAAAAAVAGEIIDPAKL